MYNNYYVVDQGIAASAGEAMAASTILRSYVVLGSVEAILHYPFPLDGLSSTALVRVPRSEIHETFLCAFESLKAEPTDNSSELLVYLACRMIPHYRAYYDRERISTVSLKEVLTVAVQTTYSK